MYCLCVNVYCYRVTTQLQLINISYIISKPLKVRNSWYSVEIRTKNLPINPLCFVSVCETLYFYSNKSAFVEDD